MQEHINEIGPDFHDGKYNPYNSLNVEIKLNDIQSILRSYGLPTTVHNIEYYKLAFVHRSYTKKIYENDKIETTDKPDNCLELQEKSNERLEFLGDGLLEAITKFYLYKRFPEENEGFMTEKKIALVKNESIGKLAYDLKLNKWLLLSNCAEEKKNRSNYKKLGCLFEAFLGAIFLDMNNIKIEDEDSWFENVFTSGPGFQLVQVFLENVFERHIDWNDLIHNDDNFKNKLQIIIQKEFKITPDYLEINRDMDGYEMGVYICLGVNIHNVASDESININDLYKCEFYDKNLISTIREYYERNDKIFLFLAQGKHKIKRKAEKIACEQALKLLNYI